MKKITVTQICFIALGAVINVIGGNLALMLRLPIYMDAIGTFLVAALLGPVYGVIPGIISGLIAGVSTDIYALYFIPVQIITGVMAGIVFKTSFVTKWKMVFGALFISVPGTLVSASIAAYVFGGVTSSGSSLLVVLLQKMGMNLVASAFLVQVLTDYMDRILSLGIVVSALAVMSNSMKMQIRKGKTHGQI